MSSRAEMFTEIGIAMPLRRHISACASAVCSTQLPICTISSLSSAGGRKVDGSSSRLRCGALRAPAHERLAADREAPGERQDRLVGEHQLVARQRVAQAPLELDVVVDLPAQALVEELQPAPARGLGPVHREVGLAEHRLGVGVGVARDRDADAREHRDFRAAHRDRVLERVEHARAERERLLLAFDVLGEDHELVAAEARDRVAVAHQRGEALGDRHEQPVADVVPEVVVDGLELVEVDEQHRHRAVAAVHARERLARAIHQQQPVGQPRERVVQRLALEPHAVGHVLRGRVPGVAVAARAPQQPAPGAVAVAVAVGEVLEVRGPAAARVHQRERLLDVVGVHELVHRAREQLLAAPAEQLLPGGVQQREAPVERDRRQQVAGHLEQPRDARLAGVVRSSSAPGTRKSAWGAVLVFMESIASITSAEGPPRAEKPAPLGRIDYGYAAARDQRRGAAARAPQAAQTRCPAGALVDAAPGGASSPGAPSAGEG